jgi:hypothetical protein
MIAANFSQKKCVKTYKNLYPQLTSFANLELAWRKARKGKRSKLAVATFEFNAEGELFQLAEPVPTLVITTLLIPKHSTPTKKHSPPLTKQAAPKAPLLITEN